MRGGWVCVTGEWGREAGGLGFPRIRGVLSAPGFEGARGYTHGALGAGVGVGVVLGSQGRLQRAWAFHWRKCVSFFVLDGGVLLSHICACQG